MTGEWSGGSMFHPLSHVYTKNSFLLHWNSCKQHSQLSTRFWSTVSKCGAHFEYSFLIDKCSCKIVNTLPSDTFNSKAISRNFNLRSAKMSLWSFWCFLGQLPNLATWVFSINCICTTIFKISIPPLKHYFWQSRVRITLIKPLLCLNSIYFPWESNALSTHENQIFPLFWKFATVASLK